MLQAFCYYDVNRWEENESDARCSLVKYGLGLTGQMRNRFATAGINYLVSSAGVMEKQTCGEETAVILVGQFRKFKWNSVLTFIREFERKYGIV